MRVKHLALIMSLSVTYLCQGAAIIDFDTIPQNVGLSNPIVEDGFQYRSLPGTTAFAGETIQSVAVDGTPRPSIQALYNNAVLELISIFGDEFTFSSFDMRSPLIAFSPRVVIEGFMAGISQGSDEYTTNSAVFVPFAASNLQNVAIDQLQFTFFNDGADGSGSGNRAIIDSLGLGDIDDPGNGGIGGGGGGDPDPNPGAVPEPSSLATFGGLALIAGAFSYYRKRRE